MLNSIIVNLEQYRKKNSKLQDNHIPLLGSMLSALDDYITFTSTFDFARDFPIDMLNNLELSIKGYRDEKLFIGCNYEILETFRDPKIKELIIRVIELELSNYGYKEVTIIPYQSELVKAKIEKDTSVQEQVAREIIHVLPSFVEESYKSCTYYQETLFIHYEVIYGSYIAQTRHIIWDKNRLSILEYLIGDQKINIAFVPPNHKVGFLSIENVEEVWNEVVHYATYYQFEEVYLHNPPTKIIEQLNNPHLGISVEEIEFEHPKLTIESLKKIKAAFSETVFGQEDVKNKLLQTLYPLTNEGSHKPVVIMLYGPSGVGKTETAKLLNKELYGERELFRKQLSMFHNDSFASYVFGDKTNSLSKDLIDRQTNVLLLDEFDKVSPIVYSAFYQMFDEGEFTDKYYNVKLKNSIIICTSNFNSEREIEERVGSAIFSRFDYLIKYAPLSIEAKKQLIKVVYEKEISKFNTEDRKLLEEENMIVKMEEFVDVFKNAREIQKQMKHLLAYPLVQRL